MLKIVNVFVKNILYDLVFTLLYFYNSSIMRKENAKLHYIVSMYFVSGSQISYLVIFLRSCHNHFVNIISQLKRYISSWWRKIFIFWQKVLFFLSKYQIKCGLYLVVKKILPRKKPVSYVIRSLRLQQLRM